MQLWKDGIGYKHPRRRIYTDAFQTVSKAQLRPQPMKSGCANISRVTCCPLIDLLPIGNQTVCAAICLLIYCAGSFSSEVSLSIFVPRRERADRRVPTEDVCLFMHTQRMHKQAHRQTALS